MSEPTHKITYKPPYDCMRIRPCKFESDKCDPDTDKHHGVGPATYIYTVSGKNHAVEMTVLTNHYLPESVIAFKNPLRNMTLAELIFHYPYARFDWQPDPSTTDCKLTGGDCWVDSGSLWGQELWDSVIAIPEPAETLWNELDRIWREMTK